jgi:GT2 family glycosyltransferase
VIPVRDRAAMLERCLAALGRSFPVLVVDDGSRDADGVAAVVARHGATLVQRAVNGGPGQARNTGLAQVCTELVALLDSDCVASADWIETLAAHFADPCLGAIAPRVVAREGVAPRVVAREVTAPRVVARDVTAPRATRWPRALSLPASLDMGRREARVAPMSRVSYVPSAALLVRRAALLEVARGADVFDPALRYGEDVDLIWRLHHAGWRVRYDPSVQVAHQEPPTWRELLTRRFRYGTSAAPLSRRHPGALAPMVLLPWPTVTVAALLARRPLLGAAGLAGALVSSSRGLRSAGLPPAAALRTTASAVHRTWLGLGRCATQFAAPALVVALAAPGRRSAAARWGRRAAVASLLLGPALTSWAEHRRGAPTDPGDARAADADPSYAAAANPVSYVLGQLADEVAYGAGVYAGCLSARTSAPLRPWILWRAPGGQGSGRPRAVWRARAGRRPADFAPRMWADLAAACRNWPHSRCKVGS